MSIEKFLNPNFKSDENTKQEIESLNKDHISLSGINLKLANMKNINLINADLSNSDLSKADFSGASMYGVNLEGANLFKTNFEGANLKSANLKNCELLGADFTNTKLNNIDWDRDYKIKNELEAEDAHKNGDVEKANQKYKEAEDIYRALKISLQSQTLGEYTGKMFLREMIVKRKQMPLFSPLRFVSKLSHLAFGYGEKVGNILYSLLTVITICAVLYGIEGVAYQDRILGFFVDDLQQYGIWNTLGNLFYFSVVVFSTVGFGEIVPIGLIGKSIMIFEGLAGGIIISIFIIAIYKHLMDR